MGNYKQRSKVQAPEAQTSFRCTPVYKAASYGSNQVLVRLIELGAKLDSYVQYKSAVDFTSRRGVCQHGQCYREAIEGLWHENIRRAYDTGYTPLHMAAYTKYPDPATLEQLLAAGASVNQLSYTE
ncbi:hypothetical protein S40288_11175 [Stachybotrys chartarum IBT 40288]|nr:hypothetical protein S40288_11175 [Stachybotrys chartarum IBT 40288]